MSRAVLFWLALLMFVSGGTLVYLGVKYQKRITAGSTSQTVANPVAARPKKALPKDVLKDYELTDRTERKIGTKELAGKVHVVSFFFATCPGRCVTQNHTLGDLEREFRKQGVKFIAITCDPDTDDTAKLREYAQRFSAPQESWYFLTGDLTYTRRIAGEIYGVNLDRQTHVEQFILVDQQGKIRGLYDWTKVKQLVDLKKDIAMLLEEKEGQTTAEIRQQQEAEKEKKRLDRLTGIDDEEDS